MKPANDASKNHIVDFINDETFYAVKKSKAEIEKVTLGIYIFATLSLLAYVLFLLMDNRPFEWINFFINIFILIIYYCLAVYSSYQPFSAFVAAIGIIVGVIALDIIFASQVSMKGLILKTVMIVYIALRLDAAKKVQDYESKNVK